MYVYRVFERDPPQSLIIQQSENAYEWLRDAEIAAIHELGEVPPQAKQVWMKENNFIHFTYFQQYRLEVIEVFVIQLAPFQPP